MQDLVDGKGKKYSDAMLIPQISVNIRKRAPIVRNKAAYFCVSGILERETKIEATGILSLKYENDIYYWATVKGKQETCIRGPKDSRDVAAAH